ncbi:MULTISPECIES: hypothetical protein [Pseudoalteromonas]|uniref:hypothetical protein n=1 Tax=Pseudoalteromonas TaxID=53246 RepID=UPI000B235040|nr:MULTISPECIES: hypothetical protein [Pseudoalteromonas]MCG7560175.1 hypothetical protein [Pseudoalteromonas sp. McH1-42]MEC4088890.1 hypothetical protein [Pseudoalteromonas rubra]
MKLKLSKRKLKGLTADTKALPGAMTPKVAGGWWYTQNAIQCLPELTDVQKGCPTYDF